VPFTIPPDVRKCSSPRGFASLIQVNVGGYRCRALLADPQIGEQAVHSAGPIGAVGLLGKAISLQDIANLAAGANDLESDAARGEVVMQVAQHLGAGEVDGGRR